MKKKHPTNLRLSLLDGGDASAKRMVEGAKGAGVNDIKHSYRFYRTRSHGRRDARSPWYSLTRHRRSHTSSFVTKRCGPGGREICSEMMMKIIVIATHMNINLARS